ncbi:putative WRKY transcription factor 2-like [Hibiscus syriacus]|uniref:WRKY transcription factor 2-like n=1 Tax=Hibiscus syriacus TaxID=106335 RepID=A0A6A3CBV7_HIBSY|nr:putative WRKY transcription factor 2-like [Hibiscus syriacus]
MGGADTCGDHRPWTSTSTAKLRQEEQQQVKVLRKGKSSVVHPEQDLNYMGKRRVPNGPEPIHNRTVWVYSNLHEHEIRAHQSKTVEQRLLSPRTGGCDGVACRAIFVDSGYNKEAVFRSIRPPLEPMITPETMTVHPVKELHELCQKEQYELRNAVISSDNGISSITVEVEANGRVFKHTSTASDKKMAKKLASKEVLKSLKEANFR